MVFIVKVINGQKTIVPVTADAGAGNPVGTIIVVCSNQIPSNYLPLGTQFDTSLYPVLYALLGTDTTPTASALGLPTLTSGQYAIKATSGLSENAQDNVVAQLNEERSYSTEEINTGKKWIDGKPIYRKVFKLTAKLNDGESLRIPYCESIIQCYGNYTAPWGGTNTHIFPAYQGNTYFAFDGLIHADANRDLQLTAKYNGNASFIDAGSEIVVEYTKTT